MWIRKCELDAQTGSYLPIPARIASNEEFVPPPPTPRQRAYERRAAEISERNARRLGMDRRAFLRSGAGTAAALL
ncbi:MAG TPA: hypothetical protein VIL46_01820, partial [Gemmataceae bacterium]